MRIKITVMCQKRNEQILHYLSELSKICPAVLVQSILPKFRMQILNFLSICIKLRPKNSPNLSVLKLLAAHRLKASNRSYHSWTYYQLIYRSDARSYEHYWTSRLNKVWKKFRPVRDLNPWPLRYRCYAQLTNWANKATGSWPLCWI